MRVLFLTHNHPRLQPGGTEAFALGLFRALRDDPGVEGLFLAGTTEHLRPRRPGTLLQAAGDAADEMLVSLDHFDRFYLSQHDIYGLASLTPMIDRLTPDVIHLHHPLFWGVEGIDMLRRAAPRAAMVATLHDYFALCPQEGQLLTTDGRLCQGASPDACRRCLPDRDGSDFTLRDTGLRGAFAAFEVLLAPSDFLRSRFVAAGWDAARFRIMRNAVAAAEPAPPRPAPDGRRDRFAVFGNVNRFKGTLVALGASARLSDQGVAHRLDIHGEARWASETFRAELDAAFAAAPAASHRGGYAPEEIRARIATADWVVVPSIWWENAPLVVLEAFRHGRPVICSGIGGMAEAVRDGVDGLHAPVADPAGFADVMRHAAETPGLWERLRAGIRPPPDFAAAAAAHLGLYRELVSSQHRRTPRAFRSRTPAVPL